MFDALTSLSGHSFESDDFFPIKDTLQEIIALYAAGEEAASSVKLRELTDNIITASTRSIEELFSEECLQLIFTFVGDGAHELSLHLLSFLTIFNQNAYRLQEFATASPENLSKFLRPFQHIENPEILSTYSDFLRDLNFSQESELGYTILKHIISSMFTSASFSKVQSFGVILRQLLSAHNLCIADLLFAYLNTYLSEHYSEIVGYGKLSASDLVEKFRALEALRTFPRSDRQTQSICERLTSLDADQVFHKSSLNIDHIIRVSSITPVSGLPINTSQAPSDNINRITRSSTPIFIANKEQTIRPEGNDNIEVPKVGSCPDDNTLNKCVVEEVDLDAFFIIMTCLVETVPLAFSLAINITADSRLQSGGLVELTQDGDDRRSNTSMDSMSQSSSRFLLSKNTEQAGAQDDSNLIRSESSSMSIQASMAHRFLQGKPVGIDDMGEKEDIRLQRSMMPPRHTEPKKSCEYTTLSDLTLQAQYSYPDGSVGKLKSPGQRQSDTNRSNTPVTSTELNRDIQQHEYLPELDQSPMVQAMYGHAYTSSHSIDDINTNSDQQAQSNLYNNVFNNITSDEQAFEDLFMEHFMPSALDNELPPVPVLGSQGAVMNSHQSKDNYYALQPQAQNSESDNFSFQMINLPDRPRVNPALVEQAENFLQMIKLLVYRSALLFSDPSVSTFIKFKILNLILLLSDVARDYKHTEFFNVMLESSCYDSILHLSIKMEHASVLHSMVYSLFTAGMNALKTFLLNTSIMTAILHKLKLVYDDNLLHTGRKATQCKSFQEFVEYLAVNGLYPLRKRTSLIALAFGLVKYWVSTCCGLDFSFTGLFIHSPSLRSSIQFKDIEAPSKAGTSTSVLPSSQGGHSLSSDTSLLPSFINFTNPNNRCTLIQIPGITTDAYILLMKRFLSIFVLSTRTARYFYHVHPVQHYSTPVGTIVSLNMSLHASIPSSNPGGAGSTATSLIIRTRGAAQDALFTSPKPLLTSTMNVLPHSTILSDYMCQSILREEDLIGSNTDECGEISLEVQAGNAVSKYTDTGKQHQSQKIVTRYAVELPQSPTKLSHFTDTHIGTSGISLLESTSLLVASATGSVTHSAVCDMFTSANGKKLDSTQVSKDEPKTYDDENDILSEESDNLVPNTLHEYQDAVVPPTTLGF